MQCVGIDVFLNFLFFFFFLRFFFPTFFGYVCPANARGFIFNNSGLTLVRQFLYKINRLVREN